MKAVKETKLDQHVIIGGPIAFDEKGQNTEISAPPSSRI